MDLVKKKYKRNEVVEILEAYKTEYENKLAEQKARIFELTNQISTLNSELCNFKDRESLIVATLERAEKNAIELKETARLKYSLEIERLNKFSEKWDKYFEELKERYLHYAPVQEAIELKSQLDCELSSDKSDKIIIEEMDKRLNDATGQVFDPKSKIREYIATTGDNGFNMDEVLNPGELELEDLCKELGLIDSNE